MLTFLAFGTPPFLTVMPAKAGTQSGGIRGLQGATKKDAEAIGLVISWRP